MDALGPPDGGVQQAARGALETWLASLAENPAVAAVVPDEEHDGRWFVRVNGEAKDAYSVWFTLDQRTLGVESYVMPVAEENHAAFFEQLLRRNDELRDVAFSIGDEHAIFLKGRVDLRHVEHEVLDRVLGEIYETVERSFQSALRLGFASRMGIEPDPGTDPGREDTA